MKDQAGLGADVTETVATRERSGATWLRVVRRSVWGVGDQAFSSLTNFALGVFVARTEGPAGFGAFSLAFATYTVLLSVSRALGGEPMVVRFAAVTDRAQRESAARSATGVAVAVGTVAGLGCLLIGWAARGSTGQAFSALGLTLPGLLLQEAWRGVFFMWGRPARAFVNDLIWAVVLVPALLTLKATGRTSVFGLTVVWGVAATIGAIVGMFQAGLVPRPLQVVTWLRAHRDLASRYLGELLILSATPSVALFGVGAVAGLAALGAVRAAQVLFGPIYVFSIGLRAVAVPEAVRLAKSSIRKVRRLVGMFTAAVLVIGFLWTLGAFLLPDHAGIWLLKSAWAPARRLIVPIAAAMIGSGVITAATVGLRAFGSARRSFRARVVTSPLIVAGTVTGGAVGGALGAAWGMASAIAIGVVVFNRQFVLATRDHTRTVATGPSESALPQATMEGPLPPALDEMP
jgi:O-antigen/teichoic acid export membrane protein